MRENVRRELAAEVRESVPRAPGVYAFFDDGGRLLYVGKSVKLRERVASYFQRDPVSADPHLGRMVASIRSFAWWQTRSELLALLLEDVMIKEHLPPLNTRLKELEENRYLELTDDSFPACLIVEHVPDFGRRDVCGPFKDKYFAAALRDILHETLGVRTCSEPDPSRKCLDYDIGQCSGPCRGAPAQNDYRRLVAAARDFLRGDAQAVVEKLVAARDLAAAEKRYEEAARLRDVIETCRRFEIHETFSRRFTTEDCRVRCDAEGIEYRFAEGALLAPRVVVVARGHSAQRAAPSGAAFDAETAGRHAVAFLHQPPPKDRRLLADRTRIVCNWARRWGDDCRVWFGDVECPMSKDDPSPPPERE